MAWVKVDDSFQGHPKFLDVGLAGIGLWTAGNAYCSAYLTDGHIPKSALRRLTLGEPCDEAIAQLIDAGLWDERDDGDGWDVHDYLDYNPSAAEVRSLREKRAAAGRKGGQNRHNSTGQTPAPTRPEPVEATAKQDAKQVASPLLSPRPGPNPSTTPTGQPTCDPNADQVESHASPHGDIGDPEPAPDQDFDTWWQTYPARNGKRIGKAKALTRWRKLKPAERSAALVAVRHYAAARGGPGQLSPADPHRWLNDRSWTDWSEPAPAVTRLDQRRPGRRLPSEVLAARRQHTTGGDQ